MKQVSEHTCTGLGVTSPGCGALAGSDLGLLAAGCLGLSCRLLLSLRAALRFDLIKMMLKHLFYMNKCCSTNFWSSFASAEALYQLIEGNT